MKNSLKIVIGALIVLLIGASCVVPGDLRALQQNLDDYQEGVITKPIFDANTAAILAEVDARTEAIKEQGRKIPTDPISLLIYAGGLASTILGGSKLTNMQRDRRRVERKEPV